MLYYICRLTDSSQWEGLRSTADKDYADQLAEHFSEQCPHAYIEVLTWDEFHGGPDKWAAMAICN